MKKVFTTALLIGMGYDLGKFIAETLEEMLHILLQRNGITEKIKNYDHKNADKDIKTNKVEIGFRM